MNLSIGAICYLIMYDVGILKVPRATSNGRRLQLRGSLKGFPPNLLPEIVSVHDTRVHAATQ